MFKETFNKEAINQNIHPVTCFFRTYGEDTAEEYSTTLIELMGIVAKMEQNSPGTILHDMEDYTFKLMQLNRLVHGLRNPLEVMAVSCQTTPIAEVIPARLETEE